LTTDPILGHCDFAQAETVMNDARSTLLRVARKIPWYAVIAFYFPAAVVALGGTTLFSAGHRRLFGYPLDLDTPSGRVGNAIWMPAVMSILILGAGLAVAETVLVLWCAITRLLS
jgi:hypothetical protein